MAGDVHALARTLMRVAVVGGGWAGIAAAVHATRAGHAVTLFEMAAQLGGRARSVDAGGARLDNGQHILIGAYVETLALMRTVGVDPQEVLARQPLALVGPDGQGLRLRRGPAVPAFVAAVLRHRGWSWRERAALLRHAAAWALAGFEADAACTVERLCAAMPQRVRDELVAPLCVAALNTPAPEASAQVFLRVLRDALFAGRGAADLLLPRAPLSEVLPAPARAWLQAHGSRVRLGHRVQTLTATTAGWAVDGEDFDAVVLACTAHEAARLARAVAPAWAAQAAAFEYQPIVTVYLDSAGTRLPQPMTALPEGPDAPAQYVFDHGALGACAGRFAAVVSGARAWTQRGLEVTAEAVRQQLLDAFAPGTWRSPPLVRRVLADKRATFACTPGLQRPATVLAPRLCAAGDYVAGPYPATLEGAVRAGKAATAALT
ncbi:hydroxysqualene dehydroxylase HpnE [Azohydromonas sediminis]|uniref:hydroxysqualene dehydroxylase HpnE n=1 Tax=Azohydromonas sediminis TaxID=2259674 RepID=UPI0030130FF9